MSISPMAIKAYTSALESGNELKESQKKNMVYDDFTDTLKKSLNKVNSMQTEKNQMIKAFASGENQNVHELMIAMQKAGVAMQMTTAVRGKVMEAYKELMHMPF
ncbi:flagellar hook-basal body complex protein FliE [Desulfonatronovibrio hydrogenovorans]|uniref:flagellar hook-basal body complex protein FliE n=1 Tax=Desulfonatronovibrio hydrogenovorans TaxID=53245 RepID=UPI00048FEB02|nr:flagellar hook-basal body complex protein FliE [Desulfonatronovibrio hydrogenovorans]